MANITFNVAKGRVVEFYYRVKNNDPSNSAFVLVVLDSTGLEANANLQDYTTLAAVLAASNNEATNTGYSRKVLTDSDLASFPGPDNTNNRYAIDLPDQTFTSIGAGNNWGALLVCYDSDTTGGSDSNIIPMTKHDFAAIPDGNNIIGQVNSVGFVLPS